MTLIKQEFQKHIKKINNNDFIYKHKIAFYLLSEQQFKLYEEGFKKGLYYNINKRKKAGTSRSKKKSTITKKAYKSMLSGFKK